MSPYNGHSQILPSISNYGTCCEIRIFLDEALLIIAEICKKLSILLEQLY
jgi:hypothetical protein